MLRSSPRFAAWLINLDGSTARLSASAAALDGAGIAWERVPAVDGRGRAADSFPDYDAARCLRSYGSPLQGAEVACYLSHLEALRRFLASDNDLALIFEDDMQFRPGLADLVAGIGQLHATGQLGQWGVLNLKNPAKRSWTRVADLTAGGATHVLCRAHYFPVTTTAMMWTRDAARDFLALGPVIAPVDQRIRDWMTEADLGLAFLAPAPVSGSDAPSDIDALGPGDVPARRVRRHDGSLRQFLIRQWRLARNRRIAARHQARWRHAG